MKQISQTSSNTAVKGSAAVSLNGLPTAAGAIPPILAAQFQRVPIPTLPEMTRLPRPRERCPITGASRTWLVEQDAALPAPQRFIFRVRQRGKKRGAVFMDRERLMNFLRRAQIENGK